MSKILEITNINKSFVQGESKLDILKNTNLAVESGEFVSLVGPSGCGKSTLLQVIGLLDSYDSGTIKFLDKDYADLTDKQKTLVRRSDIGFVFQYHHLLGEFTALENVMLPLLINGMEKTQAEARVLEVLADLKMDNRASHKPGKLSGGEQQRVAIARAIVHRPKLLLADEPTGNLDPENSDNVFVIFKQAIAKYGITTIFVTHNIQLAQKSDRVLTLHKGALASTF